MNDLSFGFTLLSCLIGLVAAAIIETTLPPGGTPRATARAASSGPVPTTAQRSCVTTVAQAPAAAQ